MSDAAQPVAPAWRRRYVEYAVVGGVFAADVVAQSLAAGDVTVASPAIGLGPVIVAAIGAVMFWWWRRYPLAVQLGTVGVLLVAAGAFGEPLFTQQSGIVIALGAFATGSWCERRRVAAAVTGALAVVVFAGAVSDGSGVLPAAAGALAVLALPWVIGAAIRSRRHYLEEVERRLAAAERDRDERARRAVLDERTHIARELHDVVAHHVSLIGVQASAARTALATSPAQTAAALVAIEEASRSAVGEMRHLLDALRSDDSPSDVHPQPGLDDLDRLIGGFEAAGLHVVVERTLTAAPSSPALELTCYRIIEEALTNVTRHSAARQARVTVDVEPTLVRLSVTDPGPPRPSGDGTGRGLTGMRERIALFGGKLDVGPIAAGGFAVRAELPRS